MTGEVAVSWEEHELQQFLGIIEANESMNQLDRIAGRLEMSEFVKRHGRAKCDAMFAEIKRRDAAARKARKRKVSGRQEKDREPA